jgi:hypothetical protein
MGGGGNNNQYSQLVKVHLAVSQQKERKVKTLILEATVYISQRNFKKIYFLPTHCIYVFCVDLSTNSDYFAKQH